MRKREWLFVIAAVFITWALDASTKQWALNFIQGVKFYGPFGLVLHRNPGAMLGMFSDLPPILRIVSLSTGGAFLVFAYTTIQYLLPMKSLMLRVGMSLLLGGILGNVTDRILWGSVVDFLLIGSRKFSTPAFNVADAIQWVGYIMVVYALIRDGQQLWPTENTRKKIWINPKFQLKYCFILMVIGFGFSIIAGVFSYTYLQVMIDELVIGSTTLVERKFLTPFIFTFFSLCGGFILFLFLIGRVLSHRTAGPLYAFELFLDSLLRGEDKVLRLRTGDEFHHLQEIAERMRNHFIEQGTISPEIEGEIMVTEDQVIESDTFVGPVAPGSDPL
ncbi:MAG: signal peptidase II [Bdellovibrionaceae bacterium]|nr:signal peptidase II [Pseudobdellovibrionaceae bacterium]